MSEHTTMIRMRGDKQLRKVKRLIRSLCANYFEETCLLLDDYDAIPCPQMITYSLCCRYFRTAVLPADVALHAELMNAGAGKRCAACGQSFAAKGKNAVYCQSCAAARIRKSKRMWRQNTGIR